MSVSSFLLPAEPAITLVQGLALRSKVRGVISSRQSGWFPWNRFRKAEVLVHLVFESQSGAEESNRQAADFVKKNLPALAKEPPTITSGEVIASQTVRSGVKSATT